MAVALADGSPGMLPDLAGAGVTEFVVVATPPPQPAAATAWVMELAAQWGVTPGASSGEAAGQSRACLVLAVAAIALATIVACLVRDRGPKYVPCFAIGSGVIAASQTMAARCSRIGSWRRSDCRRG